MFNLYLFNQPLFNQPPEEPSPPVYPHIILDGRYTTCSQGINRAYVIGRDSSGVLVYGSALDQAEIDLVGERLDFELELSIPTESEADDVAQAMLDKQRLSKARGFILAPPNCGQELWDVIAITDSLCAQTAATYRVVGLKFEYEPAKARYQHKLTLGGT